MQIYKSEVLNHVADSSSIKLKGINTRRGLIIDRNNTELARSIPVSSMWADPKVLVSNADVFHREDWQKLASVLDMKLADLNALIQQKRSKRFIWLKRQLSPEQTQFINRLKIPGVYLQAEQRRYYPTAEINAHVLGFTGIDSRGLEGIERAFNEQLSGTPGKEKVVVDLHQRVIENKGIVDEAKTGEDIQLSIDSRIQAYAYRELKAAVLRHRARAGSAVIIDVDTGEILSMVNQPSYNPNRGDLRRPEFTRNRAVTDMFEPGSTAKPFTVVAALEAGIVRPGTVITTTPGRFRVGRNWVRDYRNLGPLSVTQVLQKSSNVGVSKLALALEDDVFLDVFYKLGFGIDTGSGFPGESSGKFSIRPNWSKFEKATLSYGYGMQVTPLQLAKAYATLGSGGVKRDISFLKTDKPLSEERVFSQKVAQQVISMMETVVNDGGTAISASLESYRVAGKTGTARKAVKGGYGDEYMTFFAGIAPASQPKIAMVVFIDEPAGDAYYGGDVAAPVFANVAEKALRLLNIAPDKKEENVAQVVKERKNHG
ncbi:penicillin-binding protein 2 [Pleionea sp. CnH1-48]|uniref:peptidoglycan D,D-transpeptidase FtsI family protein n=1 Tax=Pleionea sp. CnH1-48 TaxID=2954494 RepID=UPI00209759EC|nr:penicillin-binding transpeptidase domain-containing protein [Pleionea sp. CnH1-48]MCO7223998.1 penicillin-binding transpeptidase domain-containing protein [Pleionea sp. CnH1-48]